MPQTTKAARSRGVLGRSTRHSAPRVTLTAAGPGLSRTIPASWIATEAGTPGLSADRGKSEVSTMTACSAARATNSTRFTWSQRVGTRWDQVNLVLFVALAALQAVIVLTSDFPRSAESPGVPASVAIQLAGIVLLKPGPAAVSVTLGALCLVLRPSTPRDRAAFVVCGIFLTPAVGGEVYRALHGSSTLMPPE